MIRGCVTDANAPSVIAPAFAWSRSDIMLAAAEARSDGSAAGAAGCFYWLEDDEDLAKHRGQRMEVPGEPEDFEKGKVEIDRQDDTPR